MVLRQKESLNVSDFEIIGAMTAMQTIATGRGVYARGYLNHVYGCGHWRTMKGVAMVRTFNGLMARRVRGWSGAAAFQRSADPHVEAWRWVAAYALMAFLSSRPGSPV